MSRSLSFSSATLALACSVLAAAPVRAIVDADDARAAASRELENVRSAMATLAPGVAREQPPRSTEQLIAMGELSLRAHDYEQAIDVFSEVVELFRQGKATPNAHADAGFLLAQSYFEAGQLLSARRQYAELLSLSWSVPYAPYSGRSLSRLVDIAVQVGERDALDALARSTEYLSSDATSSVEYARGKLSFARGRFDDARRLLGAVPSTSPWYHQAQYVLGATMVQEALVGAGLGVAEERSRLVIPGAAARFELAVEQFRSVARLPADTPEHREVISAAQMAIGRLSYESENYLDAARAFIQVSQSSPHFNDMLFELAWVYVRVGDYERAERALELLGVAAPDTLDVADGALIRADLMLRSGRFERALQAYEEVRTRFLPTRQRVERFLATSKDPAVYYDRLVAGLSLGGSTALPEVVLDWAREQARDERVFALIDDVTEARSLLRRARQLGSKLGALLAAPSRTQAFPELKDAMQKALGLCNQLGQARRWIALGFDDLAPGDFSGELAVARRERRALMDKVAAAPVTPAEFMRREEQGQARWNELSQALQRSTLETDNLQAMINGLRQVLDAGTEHGVTRDAASRARFAAAVEGAQRELAAYRARIEAYRQDVDNGRVQVGLGDVRYADDERSRRGFREVLGREVDLLAGGQGDERSRDYARSVAPLLAEMMALESRLESRMRAIDAEVAQRSEALSRLVAEERDRVQTYGEQLDALDDNARLLVGQVAMDNFASVRERLKSIILRADVGIVQQAWELREEQQGRLRDLQRRRAVEEQNLENELREVVDDMGGRP